MLLSKQLENSVLYTRSLNVKVSADVGTGRYCLWGGSYQETVYCICLLYTSDAADDLLCVDLGGRRIIKKNHQSENYERRLLGTPKN